MPKEKRKHLDSARVIAIDRLPKEYVDTHMDTPVVTPKGIRTTLGEAYKNYGSTKIYIDTVPGLNDYLITQPYNKIYLGRPNKPTFAEKYSDWKTAHPTLNTIANYTPFVSTVMDGLDFYAEPNVQNGVWLGIDLLSDLAGLNLVKSGSMGLAKGFNRLMKGQKSLRGRSRYVRNWGAAASDPIMKYVDTGVGTGLDFWQNYMQQQFENKSVDSLRTVPGQRISTSR